MCEPPTLGVGGGRGKHLESVKRIVSVNLCFQSVVQSLKYIYLLLYGKKLFCVVI